MQPRTLVRVGVEVGSMSCRLLFRLFLPGSRISGFRVRFLSFLPKAPVHFNTGAWALALVDEW